MEYPTGQDQEDMPEMDRCRPVKECWPAPWGEVANSTHGQSLFMAMVKLLISLSLNCATELF